MRRLPKFDPWRREDQHGLIAVIIQALIFGAGLIFYLA